MELRDREWRGDTKDQDRLEKSDKAVNACGCNFAGATFPYQQLAWTAN